MNPFESGKCPVCQTRLHIGKLACPHCHAQFPMDEPLNAFAYLSTSQAEFLEIFLKNRGNLKAVGEEINCSYPTVSKHLTDILKGFHGKPYDTSLNGGNMLGAEIQKFGESLLGQTCL